MAQRGPASNRRKWERIPVKGEVQGRIHTMASAPVLDLSENGALLEVSCVLRPGSIYALRLNLTAEKQLNIKSRVVRSYLHRFEPKGKAGESVAQYRAAVEFVDIPDQDRSAIRQHVGQAEGFLEEEFG